MIISNIIGGLGNQMFQYACGRALSLRSEEPLRVAIDQFDGYDFHHGFELQRVFHVTVPQATKHDLKRLLGWQAPPAVRHLLGRPVMRWATGRHWRNEPHFQYWPRINEIRPYVYLHGYWQSERYFADVADQIRQDFTFRMPWDDADLAVCERMRAQPSASFHVRRGDYTFNKNQRIYAMCDLAYYRDAVHLLRQRVPGVRLFAFSDDPDWVLEQFGAELDPFEIVRHNSGSRSANDMRLMSQSDHHIIANSSFSWWGAWLNPSLNKIVVAPRRWFVDNTDDHDLIPSSWLRI